MSLVAGISYWIGLPFWWNKNPVVTVCLLIFGNWLMINCIFHYYMGITCEPGYPPQVIFFLFYLNLNIQLLWCGQYLNNVNTWIYGIKNTYTYISGVQICRIQFCGYLFIIIRLYDYIIYLLNFKFWFISHWFKYWIIRI